MSFRLALHPLHPLRPHRLRALAHHRPITTTAPQRTSIPPAAPSPPRLSPAEQAEFEQLQRQSSGAFSTSQHYAAEKAGEEGLVHPDIRRGAAPEFEGEVNPKTGEVGGPKNDPLRHGDYSFNGRVTDF
ncbi:hypothetical protein DFP73DRAFT_546247 [Morchella snyderi]|nr:hypothetical protein DFP73DRAFT_546247 [Morchella snyderi]